MNECSRNFGHIFPHKLSKSNSQTAHFHLLFHTFSPQKQTHQFLLVYDTLHVGDCRKPEKSRLPASSPHHPCDVRRKSSVQRCPIKVCQPGERLTQPYKKRDRCTKVRILTRVGKVRGSFRNQNSFSSDRKHDCNKH